MWIDSIPVLACGFMNITEQRGQNFSAFNAELLAMSGPRNPYPCKLGVVEEGALADLLLVDGDPLANIKLIEDPEKNFVVIMKDGKIFKNLRR